MVIIMVDEHLIKRRLVEIVQDPSHPDRVETKLFRESKKKLFEDGHGICYICGAVDDLQVHHYGAEYMFSTVVDYKKLQEFLLEWDVYGYSHSITTPIISVDDIRNLLVLCEEHHIGGQSDGSSNGIHNITFPAWISQKLVKSGYITVPEELEDGHIGTVKSET